MERKSIGIQIWRIFSPFLMKTLIAVVVESVVITIYMLNSPNVGMVSTQEEWVEFVVQCTQNVSRYVVEISMVSALITLPFFFKMLRRDQIRREDEIKVKKNTSVRYRYIIGSSIPMAICLNIILLLLNYRFPDLAFEEASYTLAVPTIGIQLAAYGVVFPIFEEILFRGLVYRRLKEIISDKRAMLVSAIIFGLYHANFIQLIYAIISGIFFVYLLEKFGSLKACILAHASMNIVVVLSSEWFLFTWIFGSVTRILFVSMLCAGLSAYVFGHIWKRNEDN